VLCLGLGIGVNTAIFGMLNAILFRPMPVTDPERLVGITRGAIATFSYPAYRDFQAKNRTLSGLTTSFPMESDLDVDGDSEFVTAEVVSANYGDVLGIRPALGHWFADDAEPVAVISDAVWRRRFNSSPTVLGRRIRSESQSYIVVGVAARQFTGVLAPLRTDIWVPIRTRPTVAAHLDDRAARRFMLFGRMQASVTASQVAADLNSADVQLRTEHLTPAEVQPHITVEELRGVPHPGNRRSYRSIATLLAAVVGFVLLIACVNVGNLLLVRGTVRQREFAVRRALGATRLRLIQQLLTESLVLAAGGGVCGVILAVWTTQLLQRSLPPTVLPVQMELPLDWRVIAFATAVSLATTVLCGLIPASRASRSSGLLTVRADTFGRASRRRPVTLVAQIVTSLALLLVAGSFVDAVLHLQATDPGFAVSGRLYAYTFISMPPFTLQSGREFYATAIERLKVLPGVRTAALTRSLPLTPAGTNCASLPGGPPISTTMGVVGTGFFEVMGIGMISGRDFVSDTLSNDTLPVVVNDSLARRLWPERPAVGERVMIGCDMAKSALVIGVARNSVVRALGESAQPHVYLPFAHQYSGGLTTILLQSSDAPTALVEPVRRTLLDLGQGIRVYTVQPLSQHVDQSYWPVRWEASILAGFGLLALMLAALGLYGVIAYRVTLRTHEIGVRMALGARREDIFRDVLGHGLGIVLLAVVIGEVLGAALTRVLAAVQIGIRPTDLRLHVTTIAIWIVVAVVACYWPAARAARVDPLLALRCE
jgi:predicted permease